MIAAGYYHTCAISLEDRLYCWGDNSHGQLGTGSNESRQQPTSVAAEFTFASVGAGAGHSCAITTGGGAFCWGDNVRRQLGISKLPVSNISLGSNVPVPVDGGREHTAVAVGGTIACSIFTNGIRYCWGGDAAPGDFAGFTWESLTMRIGGVREGCGVTTAGEIYCWGFARDYQRVDLP